MALVGVSAPFIVKDVAATKGTALLDVFLVIGFAGAIVLVERIGRVALQLIGFAMMAVALCILAVSDQLPGGAEAHIGLVIVGFALFNTFMNMGPNATTFALPAEVFPSEMRAAGHGFAAAWGKFGAAIGTFLFVLLAHIGEVPLLYAIAGTSVLAFIVTFVFRIETRGRSLHEVSGAEVAAVAPRVSPP
jgi:nitrate/nitrite transporter NarK